MQKKKLIALFAGLSLAFVGSAALAAPSVDTLLVAGYDSDQMAVLYGVSSIDQEDDTTATLDCTLDGTFGYVVPKDTEGIKDVKSLLLVNGDDPADTTDDLTFEPETETEIEKPDNDSELKDVEYGAEGAEECSLLSVPIEPNGAGEINHGKVVSTFAHLLGGGKGCIMRHFSQSDFGKDDYGTLEPETYELDLESIKTSCKNQRDRVLGVDDDSTSGETVKARGPQKEQKDKPNKGKANPPGQDK